MLLLGMPQACMGSFFSWHPLRSAHGCVSHQLCSLSTAAIPVELQVRQALRPQVRCCRPLLCNWSSRASSCLTPAMRRSWLHLRGILAPVSSMQPPSSAHQVHALQVAVCLHKQQHPDAQQD